MNKEITIQELIQKERKRMYLNDKYSPLSYKELLMLHQERVSDILIYLQEIENEKIK